MVKNSMFLLSDLAVEFVAHKYPKEFYDRYYAQEIFDLIDIVGNDLANRNASLFVNQYIDKRDTESNKTIAIRRIPFNLADEMIAEINRIVEEEKPHDSKWAQGLGYSKKIIYKYCDKEQFK